MNSGGGRSGLFTDLVLVPSYGRTALPAPGRRGSQCRQLQGKGGLMAILVVLALVVVGAVVLILPALIPGIVIGGIGLMIYRSVNRHRHAT